MTSEIQASEKEEWLKHKTIVGIGLGEIVSCARQKLKDMMPSIVIIKEKQLWQHGGYDSFKQFCEKGLSVTRQRIYQLLAEDDTRKLLEINETATSGFTPDPEPEPAKKPEKKAKAREIKTATVIDAETGKPEQRQQFEDAIEATATAPIKTGPPYVTGGIGNAVQPVAGATQTEFEFSIQIEDHDDYEWFLRLTPIERGQAIARARQQP